jgi:hypothetical protein
MRLKQILALFRSRNHFSPKLVVLLSWPINIIVSRLAVVVVVVIVIIPDLAANMVVSVAVLAVAIVVFIIVVTRKSPWISIVRLNRPLLGLSISFPGKLMTDATIDIGPGSIG